MASPEGKGGGGGGSSGNNLEEVRKSIEQNTKFFPMSILSDLIFRPPVSEIQCFYYWQRQIQGFEEVFKIE